MPALALPLLGIGSVALSLFYKAGLGSLQLTAKFDLGLEDECYLSVSFQIRLQEFVFLQMTRSNH